MRYGNTVFKSLLKKIVPKLRQILQYCATTTHFLCQNIALTSAVLQNCPKKLSYYLSFLCHFRRSKTWDKKSVYSYKMRQIPPKSQI